MKTCEAPGGGYGGSNFSGFFHLVFCEKTSVVLKDFCLGGAGQMAHLATTYGAVMALVSIGTVEALSSINRLVYVISINVFCLSIDTDEVYKPSRLLVLI